MPSTGLPANVWYPDDTAPIAPLENLFSQLATSVNVAFAALRKISYAADLDALAALVAGATEGDLVLCDEGNFYLSFNDGAWVQVTQATFASESARNTAFAKASAAYRVEGARVYRTDTEVNEQWFSSSVVGVAGWFPVGGRTPYIKLTTSAVSISNSSSTKIGSSPAWTEASDVLAWHDAGTNPTRITPNVRGRLRFTAQTYWATNGTGIRTGQFFKNGVQVILSRAAVSAAVDGAGGQTITFEDDFNGTTDYVEFEVFQSSGGGLNLTSQLICDYMSPA